MFGLASNHVRVRLRDRSIAHAQTQRRDAARVQSARWTKDEAFRGCAEHIERKELFFSIILCEAKHRNQSPRDRGRQEV